MRKSNKVKIIVFSLNTEFPRVSIAEGRRVGLSILPIVHRRVPNHVNAAYGGIFLISLGVTAREVARGIWENAWTVLYNSLNQKFMLHQALTKTSFNK